MKNLSRLAGYLKNYKGQIGLYVLTTILQVLFSIFSLAMLAPTLQVLFSGAGIQKAAIKSGGLVSNISNWVTGLILSHEKTIALGIIIGIIIGFSILKNLFIYLSQCIINPIRNAIIRKLRNELFEKTLSLPIGFFTEEHKGDLISRMTNDVNMVQESVVSSLEVLIREPFTIIFFLITMIIISPNMILFLLLFLPVGYAIGKIGKSLRKHSNVVQQQLAKMMSVLDETISGMRIVKAFNAESQQHLRFMKYNNQDFRSRNKIAYRRELGSPLSETMGIIVIALILWYGGNLIFQGKTSADWLFTFIAMFSQIISPFKVLSSSFLSIRQGTAALDRIEAILNTENTIYDAPNAQPLPGFRDSIDFQNVSFQYGEKKILRDIDLKVHKGQTIAVVGASGAGKSTLVDLIPRFHDTSAGAILIDGKNIRDYRIQDIRKQIGVVSQDPILFNDTIFNNIALGNGNATKEQVMEAAKVANAHQFILKKDLGYETMVGDRGSRLSGGERQRITIARAVLKNPSILILDEATSSLDSESERMVQQAINDLMKNRTSIVIAHRLSTVQNADLILVMNNGVIVESGKHAALMSADDGTYQKLVEMQQVR